MEDKSTLSKSTRKFYSVLCSDLVEFATEEEAQPKSLEFPESICDLSDFTPLAELVRSFQPQSNTLEVEHEFPDGLDDGTFDPPNEYSDPADIYQAIQEKKSEIVQAAKSRKSQSASLTTESVEADKKALQENVGSVNARVQAAEVKAVEQTTDSV